MCQLAGAETSQTRQAALGPLDLDAAGSFSSAGGIAIDQATLAGEKISGKAAGTINPNGISDFSLDLASTGPSLPLALGSAESPIKLEIQALSVKAGGGGHAAEARYLRGPAFGRDQSDQGRGHRAGVAFRCVRS